MSSILGRFHTWCGPSYALPTMLWAISTYWDLILCLLATNFISLVLALDFGAYIWVSLDFMGTPS